MKVFVSSVRRGLEDERDALPGHIAALGEQCLRFEDFTALPYPSREACMAGVAAADVYVLLLGEHYGHRFEDTGQSPTHDEYRAAVAAGIPILVFRKAGVEFDADQIEFARDVSNYVTGRFYKEFASTADLLTQLTASLRDLKAQPGQLTFGSLPAGVEIEYRTSWSTGGVSQQTGSPAVVEVHVVSVPSEPKSARQLHEIRDRLVGTIRRAEIVGEDQPLTVSASEQSVVVEFAAPQSNGWHQRVTPPALLGVRVARSGQVSVWANLPSDGLGAVLDADAVVDQLAGMLRLAGTLGVIDPARPVAVGVGVENTMLMSQGRVVDMPRSQANLGVSSAPVRVEPDETMTAAALSNGSVDAARVLARALVEAARRAR